MSGRLWRRGQLFGFGPYSVTGSTINVAICSLIVLGFLIAGIFSDPNILNGLFIGVPLLAVFIVIATVARRRRNAGDPDQR
jgi:hypothetical protein